jgi:predicted AAA+ superfamily ATPase
MQNVFIPRQTDEQRISQLLKIFQVTAILGPRQCGKTTLARQLGAQHYFDLENPRDLAALENPQITLEDLTGLIVIDEIQRKPDLFPLLRFLVDQNKTQQYLILGSASRDLIRQSSESLAGRIGYYHLSGLSIGDVGEDKISDLWLRGGLPKAFTAEDEASAKLWLNNYISTFLERDIPQLGIKIPANTLRRFWTMLSHYHGQIINFSELARSFGISDLTVRNYIEILEGTFMIRVLQPWHTNINKRLVKRPKIYIRDSGLFHTLSSIYSVNELNTFNRLGASWEGFALENVLRKLDKLPQEAYFWATHSGAEVDLFWQDRGRSLAIEFKYSDAPRLTQSMQSAMESLNLDHLWIVYPGKQTYRLKEKITVIPLRSVTANDFLFY